MKSELVKNADKTTLLVDGKPFLMLAGEVGNSSASSPEYMESRVSPAVNGLGLNTLLVPVYWEQWEPQEGCFNTEHVDALLAQARREKLRLVLLWFGLWKNAQSTYAPTWVKTDTHRFTRAQLRGKPGYMRSDILISPCCDAAVEADAKAFAALMAHLRQTDEDEGTVIMVQVENEVGILGSQRDFSAPADALYKANVPAAVASDYACGGTWARAFGQNAPSRFMSWCFAAALEKIARAGKKEYPLPMYANAWTIQHPRERPGEYPSGGPVAEEFQMWRLYAPSLDFFSPDIYLPGFAAECAKYALTQNPLFIPEARRSKDAAAYALYAVGCHGALGFSPFGIEEIARQKDTQDNSQPVQEAFTATVGTADAPAAELLEKAYTILDVLWPEIETRRGTPNLQGYLCQNQKYEGFALDGYDGRVTYLPVDDNTPLGALLVVQQKPDTLLLAGVNCRVDFYAPLGENSTCEYLCVEEGRMENGHFVPCRCLNGDEQKALFGPMPALLRVSLYKVPWHCGF